MLRLRCPCKNYAWGRLPGSNDSEVAALIAAAGQEVDSEKPYAELWMGTHPGGPAMVAAESDICLHDWLKQHPAALGAAVQFRFGDKLPFLFKVLSVETALSIQSHPDKQLAERLHAEHPEVYTDSNHKPEMAIPINTLEALCGFVTLRELSNAIKNIPELQAVIGQQIADAVHDDDHSAQVLKQAFTALMTADANTVAEQVEILDVRLQQKQQNQQLTSKEQLVRQLHQQYPHDVGVLSVFFLNLLELKSGEAIYLPANEPHAYISGQLVECMATSDNVIRAGLTTKLRHTQVLCESVTYTQGHLHVLQGQTVQENIQLYSPPAEEFEVYHVSLPRGAEMNIPANKGPMMLLVIRGKGHISATAAFSNTHFESDVAVAKGDVFFVPALTRLTQVRTLPGQKLEMWIAACNGKVFGG